MLFESTTERLLYVVLLASSCFSVCISFTKWATIKYCSLHKIKGQLLIVQVFPLTRILTWGRRPVIQSLYSLTFLKAVALILTKVGIEQNI